MSRSRKHPVRKKGTRRMAKGPWAANAARRKAQWMKVGIVALALVGISMAVASPSAAVPHPDPRTQLTASDVQPAARYESYPRVARVYSLVAAAPHVIDGLYCYCHCSDHSDHYSLLECFQSDHGARCDICMSEATIAHQMSQDGASLEEIRDEVDRTFGG